MRNLLRNAVRLAERPRPAAPPESAAVLAALPVPVIVLDAANRLRFINHAAEQFLGASAVAATQLGLGDFLAGDNPLFLLVEQVRHHDARIADHDMALEGPRLHRMNIAVQGAPLPEEPGSVLLVLHDATAARALDRQLTVRGAARSVAGMAAILAHEVKNPLSGIRGAAQLLESSVAEPDRELTVLIRDEADRIRDLVDRMEAFGEKPVAFGAVNIHRVLEHVRRLAQTGFASTIRFTELYDPSLPPVHGNRDQLVQVLLNLVKNAAEAIIQGWTGQGGVPHGEIHLVTGFHHGVRLAVPGSDTRRHLPLFVTVRDNGPGIPDDILPHLFDPFVSGKPAGSGLGLALVAKIISDHGGLVEVESRPGRTDFRLMLPMVDEESRD